MEDVLPGVIHWTAEHPKTGSEVHSHWVPEAGALIDPLIPSEDGMDAFHERPPDRILLSNRHHLRHSERLADELGCTIWCSKLGLHEFEGGADVRGFDFGEEVAPGIQALEVGAICPDEAALLIRDGHALLIADGITHHSDDLAFVPDRLLGDDPATVKRGLRSAYMALLDRDFDTLLFAHGDPLIGGGKNALREFAEGG
jgi:hypothetical protein